MESESRSSVHGELSIDTRPVEEVHADLIRKRNQVHARQEVINDARALVESSKEIDRFAILEILNREVDDVSSEES
jgi:hypothetical protein